MRRFCYVLLVLLTSSCAQTTRAGLHGITRGVVPAPPGDYDLNALEVAYTPEEIEVGDEVVFTAFYENRGRDTVPNRSFRAELLINGERAFIDYDAGPVQTRTREAYDSVLWDEALWYEAPFTPTEPGTYRYEFVLDRGGDLRETDEMNNVLHGTFVVGGRNGNGI